ncbi:hypothetical protein GOODEAATRI_002877, partial [Goodea atripinnis]
DAAKEGYRGQAFIAVLQQTIDAWSHEQSPMLFFSRLSLLLACYSVALHLSLLLAAIMRGILSYVPGPMVHLAADMGTTGTGNRHKFLRRGGGSCVGQTVDSLLGWAVGLSSNHKTKEEHKSTSDEGILEKFKASEFPSLLRVKTDTACLCPFVSFLTFSPTSELVNVHPKTKPLTSGIAACFSVSNIPLRLKPSALNRQHSQLVWRRNTSNKERWATIFSDRQRDDPILASPPQRPQCSS